MTITPIYAGLLTLIFVALSFRVIGMRRADKIGFGDGDNPEMVRRIRAHGNFAEYVPLTVILMALVELQDKPDLVVHAIGVLILAGRILHIAGVSATILPARVIGMVLTFAALITGALANIGLASLVGLAQG